MKRYLVFLGKIYHRIGGMEEFLDDCDSIQDCKKSINKRIKHSFNKEKIEENLQETFEEYAKDYWLEHWCQIYDTKTREQVWSK